jgi:geranyl-CoA carboxylase beta subunit
MSKEFKSKIDTQSESFLKNRAEMLKKIKEMRNLEKRSFNASESKRKKI